MALLGVTKDCSNTNCFSLGASEGLPDFSVLHMHVKSVSKARVLKIVEAAFV